MAEYIEREAAYRAIEIACNGCLCEKTVAGSVCHDCSIMKAKSELQALPVADVRPVVLCKDCEYCRKEDEYECWCYGFYSPARLVRKDDFCSHGKAKE